MAEGNPKPVTKRSEQLESNPSNLLELATHSDGGHEHGSPLDSIRSSSSTESDVVQNRKLLIPKDEGDVVDHVVTATSRDLQQQIESLQVKLQQSEGERKQLLAELGRQQFLECREKRSEKILQPSRTYVSGQGKSCLYGKWCILCFCRGEGKPAQWDRSFTRAM